MINELYQKTLNKYSCKFSKEDIDFIGLNISQNGGIEFKIYPIPDDNINTGSAKSGIEKFLLHNDLCRCKCFAYSLFGERSYVAIKNKDKENIEKLFEELSNRYSYINKNIAEIKKISLMKVSDDSEQCFSSLHMIGEKSIMNDTDVINIEWITRKMPNPNNPGLDYKYDDVYYLTYLESLDIKLLSSLCKCVRNYLFDYIENGNLHIWLVAIDYFSNGEKKYKFYFKFDSHTSNNIKDTLFKMSSNIHDKMEEFYQFLSFHNDFSLYGFAIGIDSNFDKSFNYYIINNN